MHSADNLNDIDIVQIRDTAVRAARKAGEIQLMYLHSNLSVEETHKHDLKLEVDRLCDNAIFNAIRKSFPDHGILAEESGLSSKQGPFLWIIDPLDGSVNYYQRLPYFCTSVSCYVMTDDNLKEDGYPRGLAALGKPLAGVIFAAVANEMYTGMSGHGATLNNKPISCASVNSVSEAIVGISFGSNTDIQHYNIRMLDTLASKVRKIRSFGSTGLDIAHIAAGRLHGLIQRGVHSWDIAAARIVLEEAGGVLDAMEVSENCWNILACVPEIYKSLSEIARTS